MTTTLHIKTPSNIKADSKTLEMVVNGILEDYTDFDITLMKKYMEAKNLPEERFINL